MPKRNNAELLKVYAGFNDVEDELTMLSSISSLGERRDHVRLYALLDENLPDEVLKEVSQIAGRHVRNFRDELDSLLESISPEHQAWLAEWRTKAKHLFLDTGYGSAYLTEIVNGYWGPTSPRPWFDVTTPIGVIQIGWRKRVLNIDWSRSLVKTGADELFASEETTKGERYIHAWGYDKAATYLKVIREAFKEA